MSTEEFTLDRQWLGSHGRLAGIGSAIMPTAEDDGVGLLSLICVGEDDGTCSFGDRYGRIISTLRRRGIVGTAKSIRRFIGTLPVSQHVDAHGGCSVKSFLALPIGRLTADMMEACIWFGAPIGSQRETVGRLDDVPRIVAVVVEVSAVVVFSCATTHASKHETNAKRSILGGQPFSRQD